MKIFGQSPQCRRSLVNPMQDSSAKKLNSVFRSSSNSYPCRLLTITQAENCYCKIIFNNSLLFHAIQYCPTSGFVFFQIMHTHKKAAFLSLTLLVQFGLQYAWKMWLTTQMDCRPLIHQSSQFWGDAHFSLTSFFVCLCCLLHLFLRCKKSCLWAMWQIIC